MKEFSISAARDSDRDTVVELMVAQMREHRIQHDAESISLVVGRVLSDERYGFLLAARSAGKIIGVAYVAIILSVEHGGLVGWLEELYVLPEYRDQGVGGALLKRALERAQELGLVAVDLEVDIEHKRAESLYAKNGFYNLPRSRWAKKIETLSE
jgi:GNAT superfamily N-acetyltransferase